MATQQHKISNENNGEIDNFTISEDLNLGIDLDILTAKYTWNELFQSIQLLQNGSINTVERLSNEGLRFNLSPDLKPISDNSILLLRKLLERVMDTPITVLWTSSHIDFVPI